ncbi:MAG TPA: hypothetical protein ENN80_15725 [Candidatus Hydrogenedentes bacterium]|nr:hypothetical protein [Candidatus Hydrogenedentota bacterium]
MYALLCLSAVAASENLLVNPSFEQGLDGWKRNAENVSYAGVEVDGRSAACLTVPPETPVSWPHLRQEVAAEPGDIFETRLEAMGQGVRDGFGVYCALEYLDASGKRLSFTQTSSLGKDDAWVGLHLRSVVPPKAVAIRLCLILNGHGEAYFDNVSLERTGTVSIRPLEGPVTLSVTNEVVCDSLIGFGAEDDGWFYNAENASHGVTEADIEVREQRIAWMDPDWTRMFCWYKDWNPSGDWETFDFDTDNMRSHYRTLDLYQRIGTVVNLTGVEWGVEDPYGTPGKTAHAIGALFEHLVRTKGYTCVQEWTLTNEPNGAFAARMGYSFDRFVDLHALVHEEFDLRGLNVRIVGSDDTAGFPWFTQCVESERYAGLVDYFASHRYFPYSDRVLAPFFFRDRLDLMAACGVRKPFAVAEFGFQDARSGVMDNPIMEDYPYAVWSTAFILEGLNLGVAGFSIWCMSEVYYPGGGFMNYGLWDFKDNAWSPRPVYHAVAAFMRHTERGDTVRRCVSSHPGHVLGAVVNDTLFWVNRSDEAASVHIDGLSGEKVRIMTEATIEGDRECGTIVELREGSFEAPPQSFGFVRSHKGA